MGATTLCFFRMSLYAVEAGLRLRDLLLRAGELRFQLRQLSARLHDARIRLPRPPPSGPRYAALRCSKS